MVGEICTNLLMTRKCHNYLKGQLIRFGRISVVDSSIFIPRRYFTLISNPETFLSAITAEPKFVILGTLYNLP